MATGTSSKGGYDCEFITAPPKSLECPICLLTVRRPHVISCCGNQFCQPCIGRIQNDNKPCPLCNDGNFMTLLHKGVMREVNSLMVRCCNKEMGCDWEGELGQLEEHLNPGASAGQGKGCGFVMVECRYKCGGSFQRNVVQDHELHHCPMRPVEVQVNTLAKKLDSLCSKLDTVMAENEQLKTENQHRKAEIEDISKENSKLKEENKHHKDEIGKIKLRWEQLETENKTQKAEIETFKLKSNQLRIQNERLDSESKQMKKMVDQIPLLQACAMPEPPFFFTCYNMTHFMENNYRWWSPPFYARGYKLQVDTHMNGLGTSKGKYLSLFVALLRGENDDHLQWPFSGKVNVQMYNFSFKKWDTIIVIDFTSAQPAILIRNKPSRDRSANRPWGYDQFLSHDLLRKNYTTDDIVRFKVSSVEF